MRKSAKTKLLAVITAMTMIVTMVPATAFAAGGGAASGIKLQNPKIAGGVSTWDCVYFGNYPQSDANGATKDPIKWRVLQVKDTNGDGVLDDAFLLADKNLDVMQYFNECDEITWARCPLRSWLNGLSDQYNEAHEDYKHHVNFIDKAFSDEEQKAIRITAVINNDNPLYGAPGGNNTNDSIFLLSIEEATNPAYGFTADYDETTTREAKNTAYVAARNDSMNQEGSADSWWLRSPGYDAYYAAYVDYDGWVIDGGSGVDDINNAARPALHLNLQSSYWSYAGTVSSDGTEKAGITEVSLPAASFSYTEQPITPEPIVKSVGKLLVKGTDYTVSYMNNTNVGTATVTVTGKGTYIGTLSKTFSITNTVKGTSIKKLTKAKKGFTVKWKKSTSSNATGYQVRYSTKASMAGATTKTIKGWKTTSKKITKLKAKKKYYVQVRTYKKASGKTMYSAWSARKTVKTK